jgi:hypothetical protein
MDFLVTENTPVLAAANGIVTYVKDDSNVGGPNPDYWNYTNFIAIMHMNGEYSRYDHLGTSKLKSQNRPSYCQRTCDRRGGRDRIYTPTTYSLSGLYIGTNFWMDFDTVSVKCFWS